MNTKTAKFVRILFLVFMFLFILFSLPMATISFYAFLFSVGCAVACFFISRTVKKKYILNVNTSNQPKILDEHNYKPIPEGQMNYNLFEDIYNRSFLIYEYEENICLDDNAIEKVKGKGGSSIMFCQEPENQYDPYAVAIYLNGEKLGYVYRGKTQDMINDWIKRNHLFMGYINKYSLQDKKATFKIAFYKPLDIFPSDNFKLTKTTKKIDEFTTRQDNLSDCDEGDSVIVEYETFSDTYIAYTDTYDEIGELPKRGIEFCEKHYNCDLKGYINTCSFDENEKINAVVSLYAIPKK